MIAARRCVLLGVYKSVLKLIYHFDLRVHTGRLFNFACVLLIDHCALYCV